MAFLHQDKRRGGKEKDTSEKHSHSDKVDHIQQDGVL